MSLRQAFSKWWRGSSDEEREENPEIADALGKRKPQKQAKKQKGTRPAISTQSTKSRPDSSESSRASQARPSEAASSRTREARADGNLPEAPAPRGVLPSRPSATSSQRSRKPNPSSSPRATTPQWRDPATPTPAFTPRYVPVVLPQACAPKLATVGAHTALHLPAAVARMPLIRAAKSKLGIRVARTKLRVQVGLDFGTSTTKVMYSVRNRGEKKHLPLDLHHGLSGVAPYIVPSIATFDRAKQLLLGHRAAQALAGLDWSAGLTNFKMLLAGRHDPRYLDSWVDSRFREHVKMALGDDSYCSPDALTAAFLAYVMLRTRRLLHEEFGGDSELDISFNTCVPIDQRENNVVLKAYQRVCGVAERLADEASDGTGTRWWIDRAMELLSDDNTTRAERLYVVPESVAAVSAYTGSLSRTDGLHALVDIGAGTSDVSIFKLTQSRSRGLLSEWLSARSVPVGTSRIEQRVADALAGHLDGATVDRDLVLAAMTGRKDLARVSEAAIRDGMVEIWNRSAKAWSDAYGKLSRESFWKGPNVKVFLAGGGGLLPQARKAFAESWQPGWGPYPCEVLPNPDSWSDLDKSASFARLCVAYGLCVPVPELGEFTMPTETKDMTPTPGVRIQWEQDGDQATPRPGWT